MKPGLTHFKKRATDPLLVALQLFHLGFQFLAAIAVLLNELFDLPGRDSVLPGEVLDLVILSASHPRTILRASIGLVVCHRTLLGLTLRPWAPGKISGMPRTASQNEFIAPMLPTLAEKAPEGGEWLHEMKFDGYRTQLQVSGKTIALFTRNGHDWTEKYGPVAESARALKIKRAVIDGEMCVQTENGVTDFGALRSSIKRAPQNLVMFAFDLLGLNGKDLRQTPLIDRRRRLQDLVGANPDSRIHFSGHHVGNGPAFFAVADQHGLEGIVSKRADSLYRSGRSDEWLKIKSFTVGDFAVLGVERSSTGIPVALLASLGKTPQYVGNAMVTLREKDRTRFWSSVDKLETPKSRLAGMANRKARWLKEGLTARVRHLKGEDELRHATLQSLEVTTPIGNDITNRHSTDD